MSRPSLSNPRTPIAPCAIVDGTVVTLRAFSSLSPANGWPEHRFVEQAGTYRFEWRPTGLVRPAMAFRVVPVAA